MENEKSPITKLIGELITPDEELAWGAWWLRYPADRAQNSAYLRARTELFGELLYLAHEGAAASAPAVQQRVDQYNALLSRYGVRERVIRQLEWNSLVTAKWAGMGAEARARDLNADQFPYPIVSRTVANFLEAAVKASVWGQALVELIGGVKCLVDEKADATSPDADDLVERLRQICSAHALGDPHVYARWAPFTARVEQSEMPEGYEDGWDFLARAMHSRDGLGKAFLRTESQAPPKDKARREKSRELAVIRRAYAKQITNLVGVSNPRIESAFATVPREHFLGPGPWQIAWGSYVLTPDADPVYLYTNQLVAILPEKRLNNGEPSLYATLIAEALPSEGDHVVHIGAGVGYYTAIMAHLVTQSGRVTAIEYEPELADRAKRNFSNMPNVRVIQGDGGLVEFDTANVIYVSAGSTRPADIWLDRLADGGTLILPLTPNTGIGAVFRIRRRGDIYFASWISSIAIYACIGNRDETSERALAAALRDGEPLSVTRLYRHNLPPAERRWLHGPDWCLAYS